MAENTIYAGVEFRRVPTRGEIELRGARNKELEARAEPEALDPSLWTMARLDVRCGRSLTRGMEKPYDVRFGESMVEVARHMTASRHAFGAFVQSDEITLIWSPYRDPGSDEDPRSRIPFSGRWSKWISTLAGEASSVFALALHGRRVLSRRPPHMDCRIVQGAGAHITDAVSWRADDAFRNGIQAAGHAWIGRKQTHGMSSARILTSILSDPDLSQRWTELPGYAMHGAAFLQRTRKLPIDEDTRLGIPEVARPAVGHMVSRTVVDQVALDDLLEEVDQWED